MILTLRRPWILPSIRSVDISAINHVRPSSRSLDGINLPSGGAAPFDPSSLSGLILWLDANNAGSITQSAGAVSQWNDLSSSGNNFIQTIASRQPTYTTNVLNGKPGVHFGGVMTNAAQNILGDGTTPLSIFAVFNSSNYTTNFSTLFAFYGGGNPQLFFTNNSNWANMGWASNGAFGAVRASDASFVDDTFYALGITFDSAGTAATDYAIYLSNVSQTVASGTLNAGLNANVIGADDSSGSSPLLGYICEILAYNRVVTSTERTQIESYINSKWAL